MFEQMPEIGKLVIASHRGDEPDWYKEMGMVVEKEFNPLTKDFLWGVIFPDGQMTWGGNIALEVIGWPK